eukprot:CAMPEP_0197674428 /NCGR_PEP_ID=MMETSP1338-20131121/82959_1 /TAXON_ID=43686 ORGANISM="Pelagodinium beii, Strain RCC1491" /NCGR_SAMPLE_ID=MMETSP1338 /ASSEMBLY_ACC=CAM_ASM_000754 /LENGTH=74 /DNA_ID=CAMNT_0043254833 /DNA_START=81 /DNA_END=302 /DNA_ORIENTATION=-
MASAASAADPMKDIPYPHSLFARVDPGGWAMCILCNKGVTHGHLESESHQRWVAHEMGKMSGSSGPQEYLALQD